MPGSLRLPSASSTRCHGVVRTRRTENETDAETRSTSMSAAREPSLVIASGPREAIRVPGVRKSAGIAMNVVKSGTKTQIRFVKSPTAIFERYASSVASA